jgi:hypothetical protein
VIRSARVPSEHRVVDVLACATAELGRVLEAQQSELAHPDEDVVWEPARVLPFAGMGAQLAGHEAANLLTQPLASLGERRKRHPSGRRAHFAECAKSPPVVIR